MYQALIIFLLLFINTCLFGQSDTSKIKLPQKDTVTTAVKQEADSTKKEKKRSDKSSKKAPYRTGFRTSLDRPLFGETSLGVEQRIRNIGIDVTTGYMFFEFIRGDNKPLPSKVKGLSVQTAFRLYLKEWYFSYISVGSQVRTFDRGLINYYSAPVKDAYMPGETREQISKTVWTSFFTIGEEWIFGRFLLDFYAGVGFRKTTIERNIKEIYTEMNGREVFLFDDYVLKYHRYSPRLMGGVRAGFRL